MEKFTQLIASLENHAKLFPEEKDCSERIIAFLEKNREKSFHNWHWDDGHITASMMIVNPERTKVLLMFHKKLQKWLQFGWHSDDSPDVLSTAIREFHEESGILQEPNILSYSSDISIPIFDLDIHQIPADLKWRPVHIHYDIRFLWSIADDTILSMQVEEVDDIRWFDIETVSDVVQETWTLRMIQKIKNLKYA